MFRMIEWFLLLISFWRCESVWRQKIDNAQTNISALVASPSCLPCLAINTLETDRASKEILISCDLSELMKKKNKVNLGRRKEDRHTSERK